MTLRIASRVRPSVAPTGNAARISCGLLIGFRDAGSVWVERSLACVNAAPLEARSVSFEIDPRVLVNVRRSLTSTPQSIVGFYYTNPSGQRTLGSRDCDLLANWPDMILLLHGPENEAGESLQGWWRPSGAEKPTELDIEIVKMRESSLLVCPE